MGCRLVANTTVFKPFHESEDGILVDYYHVRDLDDYVSTTIRYMYVYRNGEKVKASERVVDKYRKRIEAEIDGDMEAFDICLESSMGMDCERY